MELHNLASPGRLQMTNLFGASPYGFRSRLWRVQSLRDRPGLPLEKPLNRLTQVLQQMPAIGDLLGIGRRFGSGLGIVRPAVPADQFDAGMSREPGLDRFRVTVGQQINDPATLQVHDDGPVASPLAPGPVVDTDEPRGRSRLVLELLDAPEQRIRAGRHGQADGQARAGLATQGTADRAVGLAEPRGGSCVRGGEPRETLGEDATRAVGLRAGETADGQVQPHGPAEAGQVGQPPGVSAVDAPGVGAAGWTRGVWGRRRQDESQGVVDEDDSIEAALGGSCEEFKWEQQGAPGKRVEMDWGGEGCFFYDSASSKVRKSQSFALISSWSPKAPLLT